MRVQKRLAAAAMMVFAPVSAWGQSGLPLKQPCEVGVYKLTDGSIIDVGPEGADLRWRTLAGRTGRLSKDAAGHWASYLGWTRQRDDVLIGFGPCGSGTLEFNGRAGRSLAFEQIETTFRSGGETLVGRLVLPKGTAMVPVMVTGHGSEHSSALVSSFRQRLYPAAGIGVFTYDKRGTGKSSGKYTQDFDVLAGDAAAAMREARRLAGKRAKRFGFQGGSQAGWILPLAAQKTPADFIIVGYGIAASPLIEDRTETMQDLSAAGWGPDVLAKAVEVTNATGAVVASDFTQGFENLKAVVAKYGHEPWFKNLKGEFTGEIVKYPEAVLRIEGPKRDEGTTWEFDAMASLRRVTTPLLWMIAGDDTEGAGEETKNNLLRLRQEKRPFTIAFFPHTEHGIHLFRTSAHGKREELGYDPSYFPMEIEFAKSGRLSRNYGSVNLYLPKRAKR